jgi:hypothetical protein
VRNHDLLEIALVWAFAAASSTSLGIEMQQQAIVLGEEQDPPDEFPYDGLAAFK